MRMKEYRYLSLRHLPRSAMMRHAARSNHTTAAREERMTGIRRSALIASAFALALALPTFAQQAAPTPDFASLEAAQTAANAKAGPRTVPGRSIPVPSTASPQLQAMIAGPYRVPGWNADPKGAAEWKELISSRAADAAAAAKIVREKLGVSMEATKIGGVG